MIEIVKVEEPVGLAEYSAYAHLALAVQELRTEAALLAPVLSGRTVWMINSTPQGGGVAELLPKMVALLRELGVDTRWAVVGTDRPEFFRLTKRLHNLIHGVGEAHLSAADRELYEAVSRENAAELGELLRPQDILVAHDPQPLGAGAMVAQQRGNLAVWRCHIGLDERPPAAEAAWGFLEPWATLYDHAVFSAPEYIPHFLAGRASVIHPGIDPLSHKNRHLPPHKLVGVLCNAGLAVDHAPVLTPPFAHLARRLCADGRWAAACELEEIGLLYRPAIAQISRWDRLKGFAPLLEAFVRLKRSRPRGEGEMVERHRRRLRILRLVLAGPEPSAVPDDPEAEEVLAELSRHYLELAPELKPDVALVLLPMASRKENALMVNAVQRCATLVLQNSLREGFGLTVAEAMWKRTPVVASAAAGPRQQIRDGLDGRLVEDPTDSGALAEVLGELLADPYRRDQLARNGHRRVQDDFLVFTQLRRWLQTLAGRVRERE